MVRLLKICFIVWSNPTPLVAFKNFYMSIANCKNENTRCVAYVIIITWFGICTIKPYNWIAYSVIFMPKCIVNDYHLNHYHRVIGLEILFDSKQTWYQNISIISIQYKIFDFITTNTKVSWNIGAIKLLPILLMKSKLDYYCVTSDDTI